MREKYVMAVSIVALMSSVVFLRVAAAAQNPAPASLEEQLRAQYTLAHLDLAKKEVSEPGTVLVIQKEGVFAVAPNLYPCPSTYENGSLHPPSGPCIDNAKSGSRNFQAGEKVCPTGITIDPKQGSITLAVSSLSTFYKAVVEFQFPQGYLEKADVLDVEDKIGEVFAISTPQAEAPPAPPTGQPAPGEATPGQALTNDDIIKLVQVKLGDSIIIQKIKSSACAFDTSTDALVKLKAAGVSDVVVQAMVEGGGQPMAAPPPLQIEDRSSGGGPEASHEYKLLHFQYLSPEFHEVVIRIAGGSVSFDPGDQPCTFKAFTAPIDAVTSVEVIRKFSGEMLQIKVRDPAKNKVRSLNFAPIGSYLKSRNIGPAVLVSPPSGSSELENTKRALEHAVAK